VHPKVVPFAGVDWNAIDPRAADRIKAALGRRAERLDLRGFDVRALRQALRTFPGVSRILLTPGDLAAWKKLRGPLWDLRLRPLDERNVALALRRWAEGPRGGTESDVQFLLAAFRKKCVSLDLRGRGLRSVPSVLTQFPALKTVQVSPRFLFGAAQPKPSGQPPVGMVRPQPVLQRDGNPHDLAKIRRMRCEQWVHQAAAELRP